ncbi:MAG TPA: hypothetical protein EYP49_09080 [Anaerolineae bacterium]|nr:hypothetical protein [Anaerolineae bacterium]
MNVQHTAFHVPLVRAVLGLPDNGMACDECQARLPAYVDAEIGGIFGHPRSLLVQRHLLLCFGCAAAYLELLDLALAEDQGRIPQPTHYPEPDLSFLPGECSYD